jgi:predicted ATPase
VELSPKYSLDSFKVANLSAMREFTDREEPTKAFMNAFNQKVESSYKVLTFYGIGGIGKSRLLKELYHKVDFQNSRQERL